MAQCADADQDGGEPGLVSHAFWGSGARPRDAAAELELITEEPDRDRRWALGADPKHLNPDRRTLSAGLIPPTPHLRATRSAERLGLLSHRA
jgi:hypothetical protein